MKLSLLALLLLVALPAAGGAQTCPATTIEGVPHYADADSIVNTDGATNVEGYDYPNARFFAHGGHYYNNTAMNESGSDIYRIEGLPEGTPISVRFELVINGGSASPPPTCTCSPFGTVLTASISDGTHSQSLNTCCTSVGTLGLDLQVVYGTDFQVWYRLSEGSGVYPSHADVEARIRVIGVPAGSQLTSCHGSTNAAVPTKATTWGLVKAIYR